MGRPASRRRAMVVPTPIVTLEGPAAARVPTPMEGPWGAVTTGGGAVGRVPTPTVSPGGVFRVLPTLTGEAGDKDMNESSRSARAVKSISLRRSVAIFLSYSFLGKNLLSLNQTFQV